MNAPAVDRLDARTQYEAANDVRYGTILWTLHERFYDRATKTITFVNLLSATTAVGTVITRIDQGTAIAGIILASMAVLNQVWAPQRRALECGAARRRYLAVEGRVSTMTLDAIDSELAKLRAEDPITISSLAPIAYNDLIASMSRPTYILPTTSFQRIMSWLA